MSCCDIFEIFDEKNNLIKEYKFWKLLIRNRNSTLGNCVAILKRHIERFSEITKDEMTEFLSVVKDTENALKKSFNYDKINWQMLMMKDRHVHFHIVPRYSSPREFAGAKWVDKDWPKHPETREPLSQEVLDKVKETIKSNI